MSPAAEGGSVPVGPAGAAELELSLGARDVVQEARGERSMVGAGAAGVGAEGNWQDPAAWAVGVSHACPVRVWEQRHGHRGAGHGARVHGSDVSLRISRGDLEYGSFACYFWVTPASGPLLLKVGGKWEPHASILGDV